MEALLVQTGKLSLRCSIGARRGFSSSARTAQPAAGASSSSASEARSLLDSLITGTEPVASGQASTSSSRTPSFRGTSAAGSSQYGLTRAPFKSSIEPIETARYRLHAHCSKHNTILNLTRDLQLTDEAGVRETYTALQHGMGFANDASLEEREKDAKQYGQSVARVSCGSVGFRKAQRKTFEAATRGANQMFDMIEKLGTRDRKTKKGTVIRDPRVGHIELVLKGFGPGRDALTAALQTTVGARTRKLIRQVTDETPIKIGGTRPKKRRKLSPPLDLSRRKR